MNCALLLSVANPVQLAFLVIHALKSMLCIKVSHTLRICYFLHDCHPRNGKGDWRVPFGLLLTLLGCYVWLKLSHRLMLKRSMGKEQMLPKEEEIHSSGQSRKGN